MVRHFYVLHFQSTHCVDTTDAYELRTTKYDERTKYGDR